jgi:hypothetical protein
LIPIGGLQAPIYTGSNPTVRIWLIYSPSDDQLILSAGLEKKERKKGEGRRTSARGEDDYCAARTTTSTDVDGT